MQNKTRNNRMSDLPDEEVLRLMQEYGRKKSRNKSSSRSYLRRIGMDILPSGEVLYPEVSFCDADAPAVAVIVPGDKLIKASRSKKHILMMKALRQSGGLSAKNK